MDNVYVLNRGKGRKMETKQFQDTRQFKDVPVNGYFAYSSQSDLYVKVSPGKVRRVGAYEDVRVFKKNLEVTYYGQTLTAFLCESVSW